MTEPTPIDRCYCANVRFSELLALARRDQLTLEQLAARTGCTRGCGLCRRYVEVVLATGAVRLPVLTEAQARAMIHAVGSYASA